MSKDLFACHYCGKSYVVPALARYCEGKHEEYVVEETEE